MKSEFVLHNGLLWITQRIFKNYDYFVIEFGYIEKDIYLCREVKKISYKFKTKTGKMRHVEKALIKFNQKFYPELPSGYIQIENVEDVKGVAPTVKFTIQSDPIGEVGVNGVQALDMLEYVKCLFESLNEAYHSSYNDTTIAHIENAIQAQHLRTEDRIRRGVEGVNAK